MGKSRNLSNFPNPGNIPGTSLQNGAVTDNKVTTTFSDAIDSTKSSFRQTGQTYGFTSAAIDRSVQDKLEDYVNVKDFGAVGDGVTDDTTAIQNALNVCNAVYFPRGHYRTNTLSFTNKRNIHLFGDSTHDPVSSTVRISPFQTVTNLIEFASCGYVSITGIFFNADNKVIESIVTMYAGGSEVPFGGALACLRFTYRNCVFHVGDGDTVRPSIPVKMSNCGQTIFDTCYFKGGDGVNFGTASFAIQMGELNPVNPSTGNPTLGDGSVGQTYFFNCLFQGDVARIKTQHNTWKNCNFYGKPFNQNRMARIYAPPTADITAYEIIDTCYTDNFLSGLYFGTWYNQGTVGGLEVISSLVGGYNTLFDISAGSCKIFHNRFISFGSDNGRCAVKLGPSAGAAEIVGNDTSQFDSVNNPTNGAKVSLVIDNRTSGTELYREVVSSDITVTGTDQAALTYTYKSPGTAVKVRFSLILKLTDASPRDFVAKVVYDGAVVSEEVRVTLSSTNQVATAQCDQVIYFPPKDSGKSLTVNVFSTSGATTGLILQDESWWSIEEVYS